MASRFRYLSSQAVRQMQARQITFDRRVTVASLGMVGIMAGSVLYGRVMDRDESDRFKRLEAVCDGWQTLACKREVKIARLKAEFDETGTIKPTSWSE